MSNKNPFEIRQEILGMAKDYMDQVWHMNVDITRQMVEQNKATTEALTKAMQPYSMKALLEKANEMYAFVTKKD